MSTIDRRRILQAGASLPIAAALGGLIRPDAALADATCFSAYDNTTYTDVRIGQLAGFPTCGIIYDRQAPGWEAKLLANEPPPQDEFAYWLRYKADRTPGPIVLDFELIYLKGATTDVINQRYETWVTIIAWTKAILDAEYGGRRFGIFGFPNYGWDTQYLSLAKDLAARTDIHFPQMYPGNNESAASFSSRLNSAVYRSNQLEANLPIYAYIWPQWRPTPGDPSTWVFIPGSRWSEYLTAIKAQADGFAIWNSTASNTVGTTNRGWVNATVAFIDSLPTPGVCPAS